MSGASNQKKNAIILVTIIAYGVFLVSHFLLWGVWVTRGAIPASYYSYSGMDLIAGQFSLYFQNISYIAAIIMIYLFFFKAEQRDSKRFEILFGIIFILYGTLFGMSVMNFIFIDNLEHLGIMLVGLVYGFYLWIGASITMFGLLYYVNKLFPKRKM